MYEKYDLTLMILSGCLIKAADWQIHANEASTCSKFIKRHWKDEYGVLNIPELLNKYVIYAIKILDNQQKLEAKVFDISSRFKSSLSEDQRNEFVDFLKDVMEADGDANTKEVEILNMFRGHFGLEEYRSNYFQQ